MTGRLTALAVAGILLASAAGAQAPASPGPAAQTRWINDHGSELFIESVGPDGRLAGTYLSGAPGFQCRNIAFPLTGWVDGARLAYAVQWKNADVNCSQITSWTGFVHGGRIFVEWVLVYFDASQGRQSVSRGFDQYRPK